MFGFIAFAGIGMFFALVMTVLYIVTRSYKFRDEARPGRVFLVWLAVALIGPYVTTEALTRTVGKKMKDTVTVGYEDAKFNGPLLYYKVVFFTGSSAKVLAVGEEKQDWGGMDHPVVAMNLKKTGQSWQVDSYRIVMSDRLNKDGITYPPYW